MFHTLSERPIAQSSFEHDFYHQSDRRGYFSVLKKKDGALSQSVYRLDSLPDLSSLIDKTSDVFISQAEFYKPNRQIVNLARIGLCFIDLDYYATEWHGSSPEYVTGAICLYCEDNGIPLPSAVISSGRGLYLKWYLSSPLIAQALPRWNAVQTQLVEKFRSFGADPRAKDASRVLRIIGTTNTKTRNAVKIIWQNNACLTYEFELLCQELLPAGRHDIRHKKTLQTQLPSPPDSRFVSEKHNILQPGLRPLSACQLNWDRLDDLRTLARLRGGVNIGQRDTFLFLATCFSAWNINPEKLNDEVLELAAEFAPSLSLSARKGYTSTAVSRAAAAAKGELITYQGQLVDQRYRFRNKTLMDYLGITPEEEHQLKTIISKTEAAERHRQRNRRHCDRQTYLADSEGRKSTAKRLAAQGMSPDQIARELGVSRRSVFNYLKD